jgi:DNA polymerase I-like protein with 3'-5' exonuclease and polymerase domains
MSTDKDAVDDMIESLEAHGKEFPDWLRYLGERSRLEKLSTTFFGSLSEQIKLYDDNRVRLNYRNTQTATGRLSSGSELDD